MSLPKYRGIKDYLLVINTLHIVCDVACNANSKRKWTIHSQLISSTNLEQLLTIKTYLQKKIIIFLNMHLK